MAAIPLTLEEKMNLAHAEIMKGFKSIGIQKTGEVLIPDSNPDKGNILEALGKFEATLKNARSDIERIEKENSDA